MSYCTLGGLEWVEENKAVRMSYCKPWIGGWREERALRRHR